MKMPKLSNNDVQELATKIPSGTKWPQSVILNQLFNEGSGYTTHDNLSDRLAAYLEKNKPMDQNERLALVGLISDLLHHFRDNGTLSQADYDAEYTRCQSLLFPD